MTKQTTRDFCEKNVSKIDSSSTGNWSEAFRQRLDNKSHPARWDHIAGFLLTLAASPTTAIDDSWFFEKRKRDVVTAVSIIGELIGTHISRFDAIRMANEILKQAEKERFEIAEFEANRGIQWEHEV